jgi:Ca2+-binding EF-hand superfamily protein
MGRFQVVLFCVFGTSVLILLTFSSIYCAADTLPEGLPAWFKAFDKDHDGQISLQEWRKGGKKADEFRRYDLNDDGFITAAEVLRVIRKPIELKLKNGQANYQGAIEATDIKYQGKKLSKVFTVKLQAGKTYQFDHVSKAFDAYLYLEDSDGTILAEDDDGGGGTNSRIFHRAARAGTYRVIATSVGGTRPGPFSLSVRLVEIERSTLPEGLPAWFKALDKDKDGQISLQEWLKGGKKVAEFRKYDLNEDGLVTPDEVLRVMRKPIALKLEDGQSNYKGAIEATDVKYQGKKLSKLFTVKLEAGKTYQIDHVSKALDAYLYLEDSDGDILAQDDDSGGGTNARIVHRATTTGTYRVVATSLNGKGLGTFSLSLRALEGSVLKGLPSWFKDLDTDQDGQISLREWEESGKNLDEFRKYDLNGDGFITADELLRKAKRVVHLELESGQVSYDGAIEASTEEKYLGKKAFRILTIKLEKGKTYQIDYVSQEFYAYLYLENCNGEILHKHNSGGKGNKSRIVFTGATAGVYRLIATSQDGYKTGAFSLSIHVLYGFGGTLPEGLPPWFKEVDTDQDGQISLREWLDAGKPLDEFRDYDLNEDGFITAQEVLRKEKKANRLPDGLPSWFQDLDTDEDGQISLREWLDGGKTLREFRTYDLNDDGLITAEEVLRYIQGRSNRPH